MKTILYISTNDGSDMRINKEIKSLHKHYYIIFLGIGAKSNCFVEPFCKKAIIINGNRNSGWVFLKLIFTSYYILLLNKIQSVHIINEQLLIFFYPILLFKHTVLDIFDSIFLKTNLGGEKVVWLKKILYTPANKIIVTDENRLNLMPVYLHPKCLIIPNYPENISFQSNKIKSKDLRILFNGWMGLKRGTEIIEGLIQTNLPLKVYMAGWFSDNYTKNIIDKYPDNIEYLGIIPQKNALELAHTKADYILCVYAPINENNVNASPNKVYDSILTETPIIINKEVNICNWVENSKIGFIVPEYNVTDYINLYNRLNEEKNNFSFNHDLKKKYLWESVESILIQSHN